MKIANILGAINPRCFDSLWGYIPRRSRRNKGFGAGPEGHTFDFLNKKCSQRNSLATIRL